MDLIDSTMNRKARLVYLDPRFTVTASKADEWYPIRPGTDMAFILALLNVIIGEERYDKEFVASACHGFEELRAHVQRFTPSGRRARPRSRRPTSGGSPMSLRTPHPARCTTRVAVRPGTRTTSRCAGPGDPERHRRELDREGGVVPNSKIALGEYLYLPWDEPTAPRIDEMEERFPLAAKGDGVFLQARENVLAGKPYPVKGGWSTSRTP